MFSVQNVLEVVKDPVNEIFKMFYVSMDISKIEMQWKNITLVQSETTSNSSSFYAEVSNYKNEKENLFHDWAKIVRSVLTIPHYIPEVKRIFCK